MNETLRNLLNLHLLLLRQPSVRASRFVPDLMPVDKIRQLFLISAWVFVCSSSSYFCSHSILRILLKPCLCSCHPMSHTSVNDHCLGIYILHSPLCHIPPWNLSWNLTAHCWTSSSCSTSSTHPLPLLFQTLIYCHNLCGMPHHPSLHFKSLPHQQAPDDVWSEFRPTDIKGQCGLYHMVQWVLGL